jgi:hypothetical protein
MSYSQVRGVVRKKQSVEGTYDKLTRISESKFTERIASQTFVLAVSDWSASRKLLVTKTVIYLDYNLPEDPVRALRQRLVCPKIPP